MTKVGQQGQKFYQKLGEELDAAPLSPAQVEKLGAAVAAVPGRDKLTEAQIDKVASDLSLPPSHRAGLVLALFFQRNAKLLSDAHVGDEKALANGLSGAINSLLKAAKKPGGEEIGQALDEFYARFAGDNALMISTGKDVIAKGAVDGMIVEKQDIRDVIRIAGKKPPVQWHEFQIELRDDGNALGWLERGQDSWSYRLPTKAGQPRAASRPIAELGGDSIDTITSALQNASDAGGGHPLAFRQACTDAINALAALDGSGTVDAFYSYNSVDVLRIEPQRPSGKALDLGQVVSDLEGGWVFRPVRGGKAKPDEDVPLGQLSLSSLQVLEAALADFIGGKGDRGKTSDPVARAEAVGVAGQSLAGVKKIIAQKTTAAAQARALAQETLRTQLVGHPVASLGRESLNALARALIPPDPPAPAPAAA